MEPVTYNDFVYLLISKLTQYDLANSKRMPNPYRLGHLLEAADKATEVLRAYLGESDLHFPVTDTPARDGWRYPGLEAFKRAITRHFTLPFRPANAVIKQIDAFIEDGKRPSLIRGGKLVER